MTDRELVGVFWATTAAIPVILLVVWVIRRGLQAQERDIRLEDEIAADMSRELREDLDAYPSITAPPAADLPSASDSSRGLR